MGALHDGCHTWAPGGVEGAYTDLLVHDMGSTRVDTSFAYGGRPTLVADGEGVDEAPAGGREWRTPPLWGVADSAPYLHDGRAFTLVDAIAEHGGEASKTRFRYFDLDEREQRAVLSFLGSLRAPEPTCEAGAT